MPLASLFCFAEPSTIVGSSSKKERTKERETEEAASIHASPSQGHLDNSRSVHSPPLSPVPLLPSSTRSTAVATMEARRNAPQPAVMQHLSLSTPDIHREMRNEAIMSATLQMMTVISFDGLTVLHQNELSRRHLGNLSCSSSLESIAAQETNTSFAAPPDVIAHLFSLEPSSYQSMMAAMRAGQTWKRVVEVPVTLSVIGQQEECRFGTYVFADAPRAFLPGGLRYQKQKELRDSIRNQAAGGSNVPADASTSSNVVSPSFDAYTPARAATTDNLPASPPSQAKMVFASSSVPPARNSPGRHVIAMTPPGRKSLASGFDSPRPEITRRSQSTVHTPPTNRMSVELDRGEDSQGMSPKVLPPRTMSLLKVAMASQTSGTAANSSSFNVQPSSLMSNLFAAGGSAEGFSLSRKSRVEGGASITTHEAAAAANAVSKEDKDDEDLLEYLLDKPHVPAVERRISGLSPSDQSAPIARRHDSMFAAIDEEVEILWEEEGRGTKKDERHEAEEAMMMEGNISSEGATTCCFHEITASTFLDPVTREQAILLVQTDVTPKIVMEDLIMGMSEGQLKMLSGIFPRHVIEFMSFNDEQKRLETIGDLARHHQRATILFMDIVGFTSMAKQVEPQVVMTFLNQLFTIFDSLCDVYGAQKVETAGDCYIAASGILNTDEEGFSIVKQNTGISESDKEDPVLSARRIMALAKAMMAGSKTVLMPHNGEPVSIRIGVHSGPCVTGLVGTKLPKFSIFGDTMNTASRMESTSRPGCIQVSEATYILLKDTEAFTATGGIEIKGKGLMPTFYLEMDAEATAEGSKRLPSAKSRPLMALRTTSPEISKIDVAANSGLNAMSAMDLNVHLTRSDFSGELSPREPSLANEHIDDHGRGLRMKKSSSIADLPSLTSSRSSSRIPRHTSSQQAIKALPSSTSQLIKRNVPGGSPSTTPLDRSSNLIIAEALAAAFAAGGEDLVVDKKRSLFRTKRSTSILPPGDVPLSSEVNIDVPRNGQNLRPVCSPLTQHGGFSLDPGLVAMCQSTLSFQKFLKGGSAWQPEPPLLGHSSSLKAPPGLQSEVGSAAGGQGQRRRSILVDQMNDNFVDRRVAEFLEASNPTTVQATAVPLPRKVS